MTLGEKRVGYNYIELNDETKRRIDLFKLGVGELIDELEALREENLTLDGEFHRLVSVAQTHLQNAKYWGVDAIVEPLKQKIEE